ncbi:hypothetical protein RI543_000193 [Arxiozyma heterogenica]|uniref:Uncharacterized protein n=1 Tax=Arxiozyma heterogenica TaxID=278026 RepID=A0AAN7WU96_9SACH|nr:hypothetical protein RI543_000193 [Kazachstania heterogenica]
MSVTRNKKDRITPVWAETLHNKKRHLQRIKNGDVKVTGKQNEELKIGVPSTVEEP